MKMARKRNVMLLPWAAGYSQDAKSIERALCAVLFGRKKHGKCEAANDSDYPTNRREARHSVTQMRVVTTDGPQL